MSIFGADVLTLADLNSRLKAGNHIVESDIVETMNQRNEVLDDLVFKEGNLPTGHKFGVRAELPEPIWRKLYQGIPNSKSKVKQVVETCGMLTAKSSVDEEEVNLSGDPKAYRAVEDKAFIEGFGQKVAHSLFYEDQKVHPEAITGLTPRFNSLSGEKFEQIIPAGGASTDNASIWLIGWGENGAFCIFPKGSKAGLDQKDLGLQMVDDGTRNTYPAYQTLFKWNLGLAVRNYKNIVRIANIDMSDLKTAGSANDTSAKIENLMIQALDQIQSPSSVRLAFYMPKVIKTMLTIRIMNKSNTYLKVEDYLNRQNVLKFMGVPIRVVDKLVQTEEVVA